MIISSSFMLPRYSSSFENSLQLKLLINIHTNKVGIWISFQLSALTDWAEVKSLKVASSPKSPCLNLNSKVKLCWLFRQSCVSAQQALLLMSCQESMKFPIMSVVWLRLSVHIKHESIFDCVRECFNDLNIASRFKTT